MTWQSSSLHPFSYNIAKEKNIYGYHPQKITEILTLTEKKLQAIHDMISIESKQTFFCCKVFYWHVCWDNEWPGSYKTLHQLLKTLSLFIFPGSSCSVMWLANVKTAGEGVPCGVYSACCTACCLTRPLRNHPALINLPPHSTIADKGTPLSPWQMAVPQAVHAKLPLFRLRGLMRGPLLLLLQCHRSILGCRSWIQSTLYVLKCVSNISCTFLV